MSALLIRDFRLRVVNRVGGFDLASNFYIGDKNLHPTMKMKGEVSFFWVL